MLFVRIMVFISQGNLSKWSGKVREKSGKCFDDLEWTPCTDLITARTTAKCITKSYK